MKVTARNKAATREVKKGNHNINITQMRPGRKQRRVR